MGRILEPEAMNDDEEAVAYNDAVAQRYLDDIDNSFVDKAATLGVANGTLLDLGAGPAKIPVKLIKRLPEMCAVVTELSQSMLKQAKNSINSAGVKAKVDLLRADAKRLPLRNSTFEIVICNSLLHHLADPIWLLNEIERVSANGAVLIRDLVRPKRPLFLIHASIFGRHYHGKMKELYESSLRAALTFRELKQLVKISNIRYASPFKLGLTHIGISRSIPNENRNL